MQACNIVKDYTNGSQMGKNKISEEMRRAMWEAYNEKQLKTIAKQRFGIVFDAETKEQMIEELINLTL